jgi:predicted peptidase
MNMRIMSDNAILLFSLALSVAAQTIDPNPPMSAARRARIEEFLKKAAAVTDRFEAHSFTGSDGHIMPYRLFRPAELTSGRKYPLVLRLHGIGGQGTDNQKQITGGNLFGTHVWALEENQARHPAFVLAPQTGQSWIYRAKLAFELLDKIIAELPVDTTRIYVTGQSNGGGGTWYLAMQKPDLFAAAVPICGGGDTARVGVLRSMPIWNFHGTADISVPVARSRVMIEALRKAGGKPLYTEYEGVAHNSREWAYTEPALIGWVFSHHK